MYKYALLPLLITTWLTLLTPVLAQQQPATIELTPAERAWLAAHPDVRIGGGDGTFAPYAKREANGNIVGIEPDLLARINALTGANFRIVIGTSWAELVKQAERGEIEGMTMTVVQPERAAHFLFSTSTYSTTNYIYTRGGTSSPFHAMEDLAGKKVGMLRGSLAQQKDLAHWPAIIPVPLDGAKVAAVALLNGEVEAVIAPIALRQIWHSQLVSGLDVAFPVPNSEAPRVYSIRKEHPELLSIINKALAAMGPAEIQQILAKWGATYDTPVPRVILTEAEQAWLQTHPEIRLGTDRNWVPFVKFQDNGAIVGVEPDLLARIKALTGANIHLELGKWTDMVAKAERGELHGLAMSAAQPERAKQFLFSTSPYSVSRFVYAPTATAASLHAMDDLTDKRVGLTAGNLAEAKLLAKWPKIIPVPLDSGQQLAVALLNHDIDAAISGIFLLRNIRDELIPNLTIAFAIPDSKTKLLYSIRKEYPELLSIINKGLAAIDPVEVQQILEKWGAIYNAPSSELVLTPEERAWLRDHPKIVLGSSDQFQPVLIVKPDGSYEGLVVDYLNLLNQQLGNRLQLHVESDWVAVTNQAIQHEIDGLAISLPNPIWDQHFLYTEPYGFTYFYLYTRADDTQNAAIRTIDLAGKRVGYLTGIKGLEYLLRDVPGLKMMGFNSNEALVNALLKNQVEVLVSGPPLEWWRTQHTNIAFKTAGVLTDSRHPLVISIRNDWKLLPGILNKATHNIPTAELERIRQRWLVEPQLKATNQPQVTLTAEERAWLHEHHVVHARIGDFPPYHFWDNGPRGISVELLNNIAQAVGFHIQYHYGTSWTEALENIREHAGLDLLPTAKHTSEREEFLAFSKDYLELPWVIFTRENDQRIFSIEDLFGKTIAVEEGYVLQKQLTEHYPQIKQLKVREAAAALLAVSDGTVDAYIGNLPVAQYHIAHRGINNLKVAASTTIGIHTQAFAVRKDWAPLASILDKGLAALPTETRNSINRKYFSLAVTETVDYTLLWQFIGASLLIIGIILYWNRKLRQTRAALQASYDELQRYFNQPLIGMMTARPDKSTVNVNPRFCEMMGYTKEDLHILDWGKITHPDDLEKNQHYLDQAIRGEIDSYQMEKRYLHKAGHLVYTHLSVNCVRNAQGQVDYLIGMVIDITDRKHAEQQLEDTSERLRSILASMDDLVFVLDAHGCFIDCYHNRQTDLLLPPKHFLGKHYRDVLPEHLILLTDQALAVVQSQGAQRYEYSLLLPDGEHWFHATLSARHNRAGHFVGATAVIRDVTQRRQMIEQRQESEQKLRSLYELSPLGIALTDMHGHYLEFNQAFTTICGYSAEELKTLDYWTLTPREYQEQEAAQLESLRKTGHYGPYEKEYVQKHGRRVPLRLNGVQIIDRNGQSLIWSIIEDITHAKQQQDELRRARDAAEAANRAKSAFIANMSHELRTPLNAVLGFAQILRQDPSLGSQQRSQIQSIQRGGDYLLTLINDILDLAKIEAGRFELFPEVWDTRSVFQELSYMFRIRAEQKNLNFHYEQVTSVPYSLYSDHKRLRQILINLLGNAIKFTEQGGVTLRIGYINSRPPQPSDELECHKNYGTSDELECHKNCGTETLWLEVIDTGIGIASQDLDKIFEPFHQTGTDYYKMQGTGLGLAITYRLVQTMGGTLQINSTLEQGSVFHLEIPVKATSAAVNTPAPDTLPIITGHRRTDSEGPVRILEVDDLADNRRVLRQMLEPLGFIIAEAENGQHCLNLVSDYQPELIFMDLRMSDLDGLQVTRLLRNRGFNMPIVALTASTFANDRVASLEAGCTVHLAKPVQRSELLETLKQLLPIEWEYAGPSKPVAEEILETLSVKQAEYLRQQNQIGDIASMTEFAEQLKVESPHLANILEELINHFEFDKIDKFIEKWKKKG